MSRIEVDRAPVRIIGHKDRLERQVRDGIGAVGNNGSQISTEWRTREDSNL